MKLDLSKDYDLNKFKRYSEKLLEKKSKVELKEYREYRTISQNAYFHAIISLFALETGYTTQEAKTKLKRNCPFMVYEKEGERFLRGTSELNTKEFTDFTDWVRNFSVTEAGIYLPTAEEYIENRFEIDKEIEQSKEYL